MSGPGKSHTAPLCWVGYIPLHPVHPLDEGGLDQYNKPYGWK